MTAFITDKCFLGGQIGVQKHLHQSQIFLHYPIRTALVNYPAVFVSPRSFNREKSIYFAVELSLKKSFDVVYVHALLCVHLGCENQAQ